MDANDCVCEGNWRSLVVECEPLFDKLFHDANGQEYRFYGLVWTSEDFYYGLTNTTTKHSILLSCVGDIESYGYKLK